MSVPRLFQTKQYIVLYRSVLVLMYYIEKINMHAFMQVHKKKNEHALVLSIRNTAIFV